MGFNNSAEVAKYIGGIFEAAFDDPDIGPKLVDTGLVVAFEFTGPDAVVVIDMGNKAVRDGLGGGHPPMATMSMTAETGNAYWQGTPTPSCSWPPMRPGGSTATPSSSTVGSPAGCLAALSRRRKSRSPRW